ncbi:immunoglobulin iota chain [Rhynchocyon petersi]
MSWAWVLLMLLAYGPGGSPQPVLHQLPQVSASLGTSINLSCTLSDNYTVATYDVSWYQQKPGQPPRFLLTLFSSTNKKQGRKTLPRFSASRDVAKNTGYLSISQVLAEDEAVYYCAVGSQPIDKQEERDRGAHKEFEDSGPQ